MAAERDSASYEFTKPEGHSLGRVVVHLSRIRVRPAQAKSGPLKLAQPSSENVLGRAGRHD